MGKRRFSGLEVKLMVMFSLMFVVAIALIVLFVTGEGGVVTDESTEIFVPQCPNIPLAERVDCFPDAGASKLRCEERGCCWGPLDERNVPWCFFSTNHGYTVESMEQPTPHVMNARLKRKPLLLCLGLI
ncbi:Sucrase-isomaltase intestinal [Dissostichus eleginoides]|uniref:Sucrase-isomaltase intestinal n=1 Tax=Dissostichus eleginoides TaxID=100907 RepID=A0AAD9CEA0_DISEL|nr:Sucrase-isomaltase intestinal [Dissostichus eleginoides]